MSLLNKIANAQGITIGEPVSDYQVYTPYQVYAISCSCCDMKYVGSTTKGIHERMLAHKSKARTGLTMELYVHMRLVGLDEFKVAELYAGTGTNDQRRAKEHKYIVQLDTVKNGLNERLK